MIKKLKTFMLLHGMSQDDLAKVIGTTKFTLSRWMNGKNVPSPAYRQIIEDVLKNYR